MTVSCDAVRTDLPEFALGLLAGDERAAVIDHLAGCPGCRDEVARLAAAGDAVLAVADGEDPPAGFEGRVLARLDITTAVPSSEPAATPRFGPPGGGRTRTGTPSTGPSPSRSGRRRSTAATAPSGVPFDERLERRRSRRVLLAIAAALLVLAATAAIATAIVDRATGAADAAAVVRSATMRTDDGRVVGKVTITDQPTAVLVAAPGWNEASDHTYKLRVVLTNGRTVDDGHIELDEGYGGYGLAGVKLGAVREVDMVAGNGTVVCRATFS